MARTAIVTGGAQGIGKGIALRLLAGGWNIVLADIDLEAGEESMRQFGIAAGPRVAFVPTDVSDEDSARGCVEQTVQKYGSLQALVNNAGIAQAHEAPVECLPLDDWNRLVGTNLTGAFLMTKHAVAALRVEKGAIVNIASTRALQSERDTEAYAASKGGLVALTHALAISLGPRIRVNAISPGWIDVSLWKKSRERKPGGLRPEDHAQHPAGRVGTPEDVASLTAFLLSEEAAFITGQNFVVDGGMTRKMIYLA